MASIIQMLESLVACVEAEMKQNVQVESQTDARLRKFEARLDKQEGEIKAHQEQLKAQQEQLEGNEKDKEAVAASTKSEFEALHRRITNFEISLIRMRRSR